MEEYVNLFENIIAKTSPKVDYIDIRCGIGDNTSILMKDGNVDEINTGMSLGARIRVLNNGAWGVLESIPPGYSSIHKTAYFEYNEVFVNYLSNVIAKQYKGNIQLLGLWHRHPGSMDTFSSTDDETNFKL